jgi:hypothetical protein
LEQILDFSVQNSQRHCRFSKKNRRNAKIFTLNHKIYTQSIEISSNRMFNSKDLHPYPMHSNLKGIKISHGSSFPSTHTKPYPPLSCTLKTFTSADACRMWKFMGFSSSKMYSLTFYSTINVLTVLTSRISWMGSKIVSIRQELEGWHTYWNLPNHVYHNSSKISQQIRIQNIYLFIFTLH